MSDVYLLALTRAWFATVVVSAVLLASYSIEQVWNSAVYWHGVPQAIELIGDEGPLPFVDRFEVSGSRPRLVMTPAPPR
jgi:hypothetical protein